MTHPRPMLALLLTAPLLVACGGADEAEIHRARTFMEQLCEFESGDNGAFASMTLLKTSKPFHAVPGGVMVAVETGGVTVDGKQVTTATDLAGETRISHPLYDILREQRQHDLAIAARDPGRRARPLVLAFDAAVPARTVQIVLESLFQAEYRKVLLALEPSVPPPYPTPPDRLLDDELRHIPEDQLPLHGANKMAQLAADCPPLAELFSVVSYVPPEQRCQMFTNALGEVFSSSSCSADIDKVLTLMHAMTVPRRPITVHPAALYPDSPGIPTAPTDTWARIAEALLQRGDDRLWLELR